MATKSKAFPYPVLRNWVDDFLGAAFTLEASLALAEDDVELEYFIDLQNPDLGERIADGNASLGLMIEARQTLQKEWLKLDAFSGRISLKSLCLVGEISITAYVVSEVSEDHYAPKTINPEFGTGKFSIIVGDPLAISDETVQHISFDRRSMPELITIQLNLDLPEDAYCFDFTGNTLLISVGSKVMMYYNLLSLDSSLKPHLFQGLYKDALVAALLELSENPDARDFAWGRGLISQVERLGLSIENSLSFDQANDMALRLVARDGIRKVLQNDIANAA
jgi:hypothetical protein